MPTSTLLLGLALACCVGTAKAMMTYDQAEGFVGPNGKLDKNGWTTSVNGLNAGGTNITFEDVCKAQGEPDTNAGLVDATKVFNFFLDPKFQADVLQINIKSTYV